MKTYILFQKFILLPLLFVCMFIGNANSQNLQKFQVFDQETQQPIIGLFYHYASQKGISDENGFIRLEYIQNETLHLSHINYGKVALDELFLLQVFEAGKYFLTESLINLQPVSVISLKVPEGKDQKIMISDQERIHHDAGAVLNLNPAIASIRKSGAFAFDPVLRGFKYDQLNIVIDGLQSANAACPNRMDPPTSQIALNRIKQIEILKGPHALRYGIGLGGTLNFIQEDPVFSAQGEVNGRLSSMYESNGNIWRNEGRVGFNGKNYDVGLLGSWSKGTDYVDGNGNIVPANFRRGTIGLFGDFKLSNVDLLQVTVNRNFARDVDFPTLGMDLRTDDTWMGNVRHTRSFDRSRLQKWTNSAFFTDVSHLMDNGLREMTPRMMNARTPANTQNFGFRSEGLWQLAKGKLYAGADFRSEAAQGVREREFLMGPNAGKILYDNAWQDSRIDKVGGFASYHVPVGQYVVSLAGRLDVNHAQALETTEEFVGVNPTTNVTQLNPGLSAGLKRDLGENFNAGLWVARVKRSGGLTERFINYFPVGVDPYEMLGNPDLAPETNNQVDLVLGFNKPSITAEVNFFAAYLTDYITAEKTSLKPRIPTSPGVRQFVNIDRAVKTGFEVSFQQSLIEGFSHQLMVAYTYGQNLVIPEALPEIAPLDLRYSIMGSHLDNKLHTALRLRHVAGQDRVSATFGEITSPAFTLVDLDVSYAISSGLGIKAGAQNIFDMAYYEHLNRPITGQGTPLYAPGRNFFLMLSLRFP